MKKGLILNFIILFTITTFIFCTNKYPEILNYYKKRGFVNSKEKIITALDIQKNDAELIQEDFANLIYISKTIEVFSIINREIAKFN